MGRTCVFCSSSDLSADMHVMAASLGAAVARSGDDLVYGGTVTGLMGAVAAGARSAGGRVVGYVPKAMEPEWAIDQALDELVVVGSMGERKELMLADTHRVIVLPGGIGTLDELMEAMTFRQLGLVPADVDIVLLDPHGAWDALLDQLDDLVELGTVAAHNARLRIARTVEEAVPT